MENLYIAPDSPWENGYAESFHARLRDELLNAEVFTDVRDAMALAASWMNEYNHHRPHSSLGYVPPARFAATPAVPPVGAAPLPPARPASIPLLGPRLSEHLVQKMGAGHVSFDACGEARHHCKQDVDGDGEQDANRWRSALALRHPLAAVLLTRCRVETQPSNPSLGQRPSWQASHTPGPLLDDLLTQVPQGAPGCGA